MNECRFDDRRHQASALRRDRTPLFTRTAPASSTSTGRQRRRGAQRLQPLLRLRQSPRGRHIGARPARLLVERRGDPGTCTRRSTRPARRPGLRSIWPPATTRRRRRPPHPSHRRRRQQHLHGLARRQARDRGCPGRGQGPPEVRDPHRRSAEQLALAVEPDGGKLWVVWTQGKYLGVPRLPRRRPARLRSWFGLPAPGQPKRSSTPASCAPTSRSSSSCSTASRSPSSTRPRAPRSRGRCSTAMTHFYETSYANVHRGVYELAERATEALEQARERVPRVRERAATSARSSSCATRPRRSTSSRTRGG